MIDAVILWAVCAAIMALYSMAALGGIAIALALDRLGTGAPPIDAARQERRRIVKFLIAEAHGSLNVHVRDKLLGVAEVIDLDFHPELEE